MSQYALTWTVQFMRNARRFLRRHPDQKGRFRDTLAQLANDPFAPSLRLHALAGQLAGKQAVSINAAATGKPPTDRRKVW